MLSARLKQYYGRLLSAAVDEDVGVTVGADG
jgi:hypothetical protein